MGRSSETGSKLGSETGIQAVKDEKPHSWCNQKMVLKLRGGGTGKSGTRIPLKLFCLLSIKTLIHRGSRFFLLLPIRSWHTRCKPSMRPATECWAWPRVGTQANRVVHPSRKIRQRRNFRMGEVEENNKRVHVIYAFHQSSQRACANHRGVRSLGPPYDLFINTPFAFREREISLLQGEFITLGCDRLSCRRVLLLRAI